MSSRMPPVPPENRNPKGPPDDTHQMKTDAGLPDPGKQIDPEKQGQQGNSRINTTHQGYQQDR